MGIFFAILSPAIYGINNYIDKFFLEKYKISPVVITVYSGIFAFLAGLIVLGFTGFYKADIKSVLIIIGSGFLTNIYVLPYFKALNLDETSRVIPLFQFVPVFVLILSFLFLGEKLNLGQYLGALSIVIGSFLISLEKFNAKIFKIRPAFWYMMLSSFLFSISVVLYKLGVEEIPFWNTLPYEGLGIGIGALTIFLYKNNKKAFIKETKGFSKKVYGLMSVNESVYVTARYTTYFALSLVTASVVNVLGGFQPFFVLVYGLILSLFFPFILKETISKKAVGQKLISIALIFLGVYLIFS